MPLSKQTHRAWLIHSKIHHYSSWWSADTEDCNDCTSEQIKCISTMNCERTQQRRKNTRTTNCLHALNYDCISRTELRKNKQTTNKNKRNFIVLWTWGKIITHKTHCAQSPIHVSHVSTSQNMIPEINNIHWNVNNNKNNKKIESPVILWFGCSSSLHFVIGMI